MDERQRLYRKLRWIIAPYRDPVRNIWVIHFGMICCAGILPLALICGPIRGIPWFWTLVDCSFGLLGVLPLLLMRSYTQKIAALEQSRDGTVLTGRS